MKNILLFSILLLGMSSYAQLNYYSSDNTVSPPRSRYYVTSPSNITTGLQSGTRRFDLFWDTIYMKALSGGTDSSIVWSLNGQLMKSPYKISVLKPQPRMSVLVPWDSVTFKPTFATVATSGSYNDLTNKPTIPKLITTSGTTTSGTATFNISGAGFTALSIAGCKFHINDDDGVYSYEVTAISNTSVTVSAKKQSFTGVKILDLQVIGSVTMNAVANGTTIFASFSEY